MKGRGFRGLAPDDTWEDLFFRLYVQEVEPRIQEEIEGPCFVKDWPASITAMAKKKDDHAVERFELYIRGLEIANGYTELLDAGEQRERLLKDNAVPGETRQTGFPAGRAVSRRPPAYCRTSCRGLDRRRQAPHGACRKDRIGDVVVDRFTLESAGELG